MRFRTIIQYLHFPHHRIGRLASSLNAVCCAGGANNISPIVVVVVRRALRRRDKGVNEPNEQRQIDTRIIPPVQVQIDQRTQRNGQPGGEHLQRTNAKLIWISNPIACICVSIATQKLSSLGS